MAMKSWLPVAEDSPFSFANIPFGIVSRKGSMSRFPATILGDHVLDLGALVRGGAFSSLTEFPPQQLSVFEQDESLNSFAALGQEAHRRIRGYLQQLLREDTPFPNLLKDNEALRQNSVLDVQDVQNHLPLTIGDYTDFYVGKNHAYNVGVLFRGPQNALQPNYMHMPVGYHGRASTVVISGTPIRRPSGQILPEPKATTPIFSACKKLDIELEMAAFVCKANPMGSPIPIDEANTFIFGYVLMNDWSARDIQAWEYVPLGPFNAKNFGTTISPWVVLADALSPFRCPTLDADNQQNLLPYLRGSETNLKAHDISLTVELQASQNRHVITKTNSKNLLYSFEQMIAHHTVTGCGLRVGDLLGSGTISGFEQNAKGSLLEITENGKLPLRLEGGSETLERRFLEDGDIITFTGVAGKPSAYVGFGKCEGTILPAI